MCDLAKHPSYSQCATCGECFTSDSAFTRHLGPIPRKGRPKCKRPSDVRKGSQGLWFDEKVQAWRWEDSEQYRGRVPGGGQKVA